MSKEAFFEIDLNTPLGLIRGRVSVNTGPMGLVERVPTALELTNMLVDRARKREEKEGKRISCQAGCGVCCRQMVPISAPEAFYFWPDRLLTRIAQTNCLPEHLLNPKKNSPKASEFRINLRSFYTERHKSLRIHTQRSVF
jgi:hypothetical protein